MKKMLGITRNDNQLNNLGSIEPRGISHTVSYASSFDDTWNHIRIELKRLSVPEEAL